MYIHIYEHLYIGGWGSEFALVVTPPKPGDRFRFRRNKISIKFRLGWVGLELELDWIALDWIGLDWILLDWVGLDWIG